MYSSVLDYVKITVLVENSTVFGNLLGHSGFSVLAEVNRGDLRRNILIDVGESSKVLIHNMRQLGVNPASIDAIVLTHCHHDHTNALTGILKRAGKKNIPIIAHPDIFRLTFAVDPFIRFTGTSSSRDEIEKYGGKLILIRDPIEVMPGVLTTGEVKRQFDFETPTKPYKTITLDGRLINDEMLDDISVVFNLRSGLVILTGCAHAGICNIIKHSIELTGVDRVKAVIGGFHLAEASEQRIKKTVECLAQYNVDYVAAGHCTGFKAQVELYLKFREKFTPLYTGTVLSFK